MRDILEAMHDYPDEALGLCFFHIIVDILNHLILRS